MSKCVTAIVCVMLLSVAPVQAAQWILINTDPAGIRLYEDRGSVHWQRDGTTLSFRVMYDYYGNLIRSIVEDVEMPCLQEGPPYVATLIAVSVYAGRMGTGKMSSSSDTLPEAADERSAQQFNNLICDAKD